MIWNAMCGSCAKYEIVASSFYRERKKKGVDFKQSNLLLLSETAYKSAFIAYRARERGDRAVTPEEVLFICLFASAMLCISVF
jgi:hypothetical protein